MINKRNIFKIMLLFCYSTVFAQKKICLFKNTNGETVNISLNEEGIINSIEGKLGDLSLTPIKIYVNDNAIHIDSEWSLFKDCFDVFLYVEEKSLRCDVKNHKTNELYKSNIKLPEDSIITDGINRILKTTSGYETISLSKSYSFIPYIENIDGIIYQSFGSMKNRGQKFEYHGNSVDLYKIMPGDEWFKFMNIEYKNIQSENIYINIINYIIIYCLNSRLGTMMFPVLLDLQNTNEYLECTYKTESFLTEGDVKYIPENLGIMEMSKPWVEGIEGNGIGSKIYIESKTKEISEIDFSNGFVSLKKQTYFNNNRVKKIKIEGEDSSQNMIVDIPDTSEPFKIKMNFQNKKITIEILDVYKGEKYQDTCINYIMCK